MKSAIASLFGKKPKSYFVRDQGPLPISSLYLMIVIYLIVAWFSEGYLHADEHFQILEFAQYYIHHYPYQYPWELTAQMRPTFQVWLVIFIYKICALIEWQANPFILAFLTRGLAAILSAVSCYVFVNAFQDELKSSNKRYYFFLLSAFSYMALRVVVHFSSETMSGELFLLGLALLPYKRHHRKQPVLNAHIIPENSLCFISGIFLGLAFISRYQTGLMIASLLAWLVVFRALKLPNMMFLLGAIFCVCTLSLYIDSVFYGKLTNSAWNYFNINILQDQVSAFGKSSILEYLTVSLYPPYGGLYVVSCLYFTFMCRNHIITWIIVPFLLVHCFIGHKEVRFLLPMLGFMPFVLMYTVQELQKKYPSRFNSPKLIALHKSAWILNGIVVIAILGAHLDFRIYKYIWAHYAHTPVFLNYVSNKKNADNAVTSSTPLRFYLPDSLYAHINTNIDTLICKKSHHVCLAWTPCSETVINKPNMHMVYDSCYTYDFIRAHMRARWMERSSLFRQNGRLYEIV